MIVIQRRSGEIDILPVRHTAEETEIKVESIVTLGKRPMTPEEK